MSQENVEIVKRLYEAVARRDSATVLAFYDPDVEWDMSQHPLAGAMGASVPHRGHEALRRWFGDWYSAWRDLEDEVEELIDAGDEVISVVTTRARGRASGADVAYHHYAGLWTVRGGKVVRVAWFASRADALAAAGVSS